MSDEQRNTLGTIKETIVEFETDLKFQCLDLVITKLKDEFMDTSLQSQVYAQNCN